MPVPTYDEITSAGIQMLRLARERVGQGYASSFSVTNPISLKDLSNLNGGNAGGSGNSFPAVNMLNIQSANFFRNRRPDGANPLKVSEFLGYDQTLIRREFRFAYSSTSSTNACNFTINATSYWHDGSNTLPVDGDRIWKYATGTASSDKAEAGYYQIFDPSSGVSEGTYGEVLGGGGGFSGQMINISSC
tara:strand:+ start:2071 stop:2640 length:570 start_codon:yes stop_codon:yes gene_type:complete